MKRLSFILITMILAVIFTGNSCWSQAVTNLKMGGRLYNDWTWMSAEDDLKKVTGNLVDGTEFRTARFFTSGTLYGNIDFKLQFDFAGSDPDFKDVYFGLKAKCPLTGVPLYIKAGHFKEPFSLEQLTSNRYITFMERSITDSPFTPGRNTGLQISGSHFENYLTFAAGVFSDADSYGNADTEGGYNITARVTGLPLCSDDGEKLLHLGLSGSYRNPVGKGTVSYDGGPEAHLAPDLVDTTFAADNALHIVGEAAVVFGPLSLQTEVFSASVSSNVAKDPSFIGYYAQVSYFITGEHRPYKSGAFSRVKPNTNFGEGGIGALELAVRYSGLDLEEVVKSGGELSNLTVGLNWHLNPNARVMVNYNRSDFKDVGVANILGTRLQIDF